MRESGTLSSLAPRVAAPAANGAIRK